ncbi:hypothetical protein VNO78_09878 [Psophocarpus tetragonolobus]|uniref:Uncharacterized protein n=1 Tax=Psophocarpus tetragonolobus TaxID=3891 RepID=A0AAN9SWJ7_PSOTE
MYPLLLLSLRKHGRENMRLEMEDWEYWPHKMAYEEIKATTKRFFGKNVIRVGGNRKVVAASQRLQS